MCPLNVFRMRPFKFYAIEFAEASEKFHLKWKASNVETFAPESINVSFVEVVTPKWWSSM